MPSYCYKEGFKPYKNLEDLSPRVKCMILMLKHGYNCSEVAGWFSVSRCFAWQVAKRLAATDKDYKGPPKGRRRGSRCT